MGVCVHACLCTCTGMYALCSSHTLAKLYRHHLYMFSISWYMIINYNTHTAESFGVAGCLRVWRGTAFTFRPSLTALNWLKLESTRLKEARKPPRWYTLTVHIHPYSFFTSVTPCCFSSAFWLVGRCWCWWMFSNSDSDSSSAWSKTDRRSVLNHSCNTFWFPKYSCSSINGSKHSVRGN